LSLLKRVEQEHLSYQRSHHTIEEGVAEIDDDELAMTKPRSNVSGCFTEVRVQEICAHLEHRALQRVQFALLELFLECYGEQVSIQDLMMETRASTVIETPTIVVEIIRSHASEDGECGMHI
jgi:hypothetical protein